MKLPRIHLVIIGTVGALAVVALGIWIFFAVRSNALRTEIVAIETEIASKTAESIYLGSIRSILKTSKADIGLIEKRFVKKDTVPKFIELLESKADRAGIKADFGTIDITSASKLRVQMTGKGSWTDVIGFISTLESLPYASKIENVTISKADPKLSGWGFGLELIAYLEETQ